MFCNASPSRFIGGTGYCDHHFRLMIWFMLAAFVVGFGMLISFFVFILPNP
jgi:hypothetical protein